MRHGPSATSTSPWSSPPPRPHGFKDPLVPASGKECFLEPQATISFFQKLIPKENQKHQLSLVS